MESPSTIEAQSFALLTLKERCHFLKEQLRVVDEENLKLKVQLANTSKKSDSGASNTNMLVEQVEVLKKQNSQLSNQINILASENSNVWNRLSKLTEFNRSLTRRLSKISETLDKHGLSSSISDSDADSSVTVTNSISRRDIEEMSLRLINGIKLEKTELEQQYAQMVALHEGNAPISSKNHDLAFGLVDSDEENVLGAIRKHAQKMNQIKQRLALQQTILVNSLDNFKKIKSASVTAKPCEVIMKDVSTEISDDLPDIFPINANQPVVEVNANEITMAHETVCPICNLDMQVPVDLLAEHVASHFESESA